MVITSLNLVPVGRLEGGRILQALFGRRRASRISVFTAVLLGVGGFSGSVLCLAWGFIILLFRRGEELPAEDEITPLGQGRTLFGWVLLSICILTLLPNSAGTFPSTFFIPAVFQGEP
jgi:membrane-associated protease RseP (regulator of RpoE activity)